MLTASQGVAIVVGSGPNGLAAAHVLNAAGYDVTVYEANDVLGGGARASEPLIPGVVQDHCAAVHPLALISPSLAEIAPNVQWARAPIECAHPLEGGGAALLHQSVEMTAHGLSRGGRAWRRMFGRPSRRFDILAEDLFAPPVHMPKHPFLFARFGLIAAAPPSVIARLLRSESARALYAGIAAHAFQPFSRPFSGAVAAALLTAAHGVGWPVVVGGTSKLTDAIVDSLRSRGVRFVTGCRVRDRAELPPHDVLLLDVHPEQVEGIVGGALPPRRKKRLRRFRNGPSAFKVDFVVDGGVPWEHATVSRAGTVHVGGSASEIARAEREIARGRMPDQPFVLVGQQDVADPSRRRGELAPVYAYAHVPHGYTGDATEVIIQQIERFAPGFRQRIMAQRSYPTMDLARENPNFVGGDILTGAKNVWQLLFGPAAPLAPYDVGVPGVYLCSAATPPGPGVHGMCGYNAAHRALAVARSRRRTTVAL
ncbi:phytoene desaturase family protein [Microbacterium sp. NPDC090003]|uniref:phytoene desaturase family protein n=1 Tax=Microbacterium sp. NPDC090003 TaxID=3364203 RepID=UPI0037F5F41C